VKVVDGSGPRRPAAAEMEPVGLSCAGGCANRGDSSLQEEQPCDAQAACSISAPDQHRPSCRRLKPWRALEFSGGASPPAIRRREARDAHAPAARRQLHCAPSLKSNLRFFSGIGFLIAVDESFRWRGLVGFRFVPVSLDATPARDGGGCSEILGLRGLARIGSELWMRVQAWWEQVGPRTSGTEFALDTSRRTGTERARARRADGLCEAPAITPRDWWSGWAHFLRARVGVEHMAASPEHVKAGCIVGQDSLVDPITGVEWFACIEFRSFPHLASLGKKLSYGQRVAHLRRASRRCGWIARVRAVRQRGRRRNERDFVVTAKYLRAMGHQVTIFSSEIPRRQP